MESNIVSKPERKPEDKVELTKNNGCLPVITIQNPVYSDNPDHLGLPPPVDCPNNTGKDIISVNDLDYAGQNYVTYHGLVQQMRRKTSNMSETLKQSKMLQSLRDSCSEGLTISGVKLVCGATVHAIRR